MMPAVQFSSLHVLPLVRRNLQGRRAGESLPDILPAVVVFPYDAGINRGRLWGWRNPRFILGNPDYKRPTVIPAATDTFAQRLFGLASTVQNGQPIERSGLFKAAEVIVGNGNFNRTPEAKPLAEETLAQLQGDTFGPVGVFQLIRPTTRQALRLGKGTVIVTPKVHFERLQQWQPQLYGGNQFIALAT